MTLKGDDEAKIAYYKALERSHCGDPTDFQKLVAIAEIASLEKYLSILGV